MSTLRFIARVVAAVIDGGNVLAVLSTGNLASFAADTITELVCNAVLDFLTAGVGAIVFALGCAVVGALVGAQVDKSIGS